MTTEETTDETADQGINVQMELYPEDSTEMEIRQIVVGMNPLVLVTAPGDGTVGLTISGMSAEQALDFLSFAKMAVHNYLGQEAAEASEA